MEHQFLDYITLKSILRHTKGITYNTNEIPFLWFIKDLRDRQ